MAQTPDRDDRLIVAYDEDLADRIRELISAGAGVSERRMFGGLAFLIDDHMAVAASSRGGLMVRVDPAEAPRLWRMSHLAWILGDGPGRLG